MRPIQSFSTSVDKFLATIRSYGRATSCFPQNLNEQQSRRRAGESLHDWFVRLVDQFCEGEPKRYALERNLAIFALMGWQKGRILSFANIQTIVTTCELDAYYVEAQGEAIYLRLDLDYETLGDPFSHPLAHIHVEDDQSPRFALDGGDSGNVILDYLEFLYRNYHSEKWLEWVKRVWAEEFKKSDGKGTTDPLPRIIDAIKSSQFHVLRDMATDVARIKNALRKKKDNLFAPHVNGTDRLLLEYPLAR
ncbi:MAG: hypothetical protein KJ000_24575 [Pirellulaceae bacterium]|nr:hypothetical protein [Pirellulaceae bacterium]